MVRLVQIKNRYLLENFGEQNENISRKKSLVSEKQKVTKHHYSLHFSGRQICRSLPFSVSFGSATLNLSFSPIPTSNPIAAFVALMSHHTEHPLANVHFPPSDHNSDQSLLRESHSQPGSSGLGKSILLLYSRCKLSIGCDICGQSSTLL